MDNKYEYITVIQGHYSHYYGWEDVSEYEGPNREQEAKKDLREYNFAFIAPHRIVRRRKLRN